MDNGSESRKNDGFDLWLSARSGDGDAWEALSHKYFPLIYRIASGHGVPCEDAEDVAQAVLIKAWRYGNTIDSESHLAAWLFKTAVTTAIDLFRKHRRQNRDLEKDGVETIIGRPSPEDAAIIAERARIVHEVVQMLPANMRQVVEDYMNEVPPDPMIAKNTVASRWSRARTTLVRLLNRRGIKGKRYTRPKRRRRSDQDAAQGHQSDRSDKELPSVTGLVEGIRGPS